MSRPLERAHCQSYPRLRRKDLPQVALVHYNLACYECQLGNLEMAKGHLKLAFKIKKGLRLEALDEPDLEPLWDSLGDVAD